MEDEERERELKRKMNKEYHDWTKKVEDLPEVKELGLEFDIPYRELGFYGTPQRASVFLQPTVNCLVNLTEAPFFVITLEDVEIANLERVQFSLGTFDIAFCSEGLQQAGGAHQRRTVGQTGFYQGVARFLQNQVL